MFRRLALATWSSLGLLACATQHAQTAAPRQPQPTAAMVAPPPLTTIPGAKNVPQYRLTKSQLSGAMPHLLHESDRMHSHALLFRICVDTAGKVSDVTPVSAGTATELADVTAVLRTWTFRPNPEPLCTVSRFMFQVTDADGRPRL